MKFEELLDQQNWNKNSGGPLYLQLSEQIAHAITTNSIKPGDSLPSERELAHMSKVSRITIRKALQELAHCGLLIQRQGSGTYVAPMNDRLEQSLSRLTSFSEDMAMRGKTVRSEWLERGLFEPTVNEAVILGLKPQTRVARISRLRFADDNPLAIENASISEIYLPDPDKIEGSLYVHLDMMNAKPVRAIQRIRAVNLEEKFARLLQVETGAAGLCIQRISYLQGGQVLELTQSKYRGDAYEFIAQLDIPGAK